MSALHIKKAMSTIRLLGYISEGYILKCDIRKYFDSIYQPVHIYTHDMEKADMWTTYLIETNNKPIQGGRA